LSRILVRFQTAVGSDITETDKLMQKAETKIADRVFKTRRKPVEEGEAVGIKAESRIPSQLKA
jgi:hypothetical protein